MELTPKHNHNSTKSALAEALKTLMTQKSVEKITIQELTELSGIRRQNFYYHFSDIYDLMRWTFENEALSVLQLQKDARHWQDGLRQLFCYLVENRELCRNALKSVGHEHIHRLFESDIYELIHQTIEDTCADLGFRESEEQRIDRELLTRFYVSALTGMVISWIEGEIERSPEELVLFVDRVLTEQIEGARALRDPEQGL